MVSYYAPLFYMHMKKKHLHRLVQTAECQRGNRYNQFTPKDLELIRELAYRELRKYGDNHSCEAELAEVIMNDAYLLFKKLGGE